MADIFCDDFASSEGLADEEDFVFASSDDCVEEVQNKDLKENVEQDEKSGDDMKEDSSDSSNSSSIFEKLASSDYIQDRRFCAQSIVEQLHLAESKEELLSAISRMCKLGDDEEFSVRSELMPRLPYIALFCREHSEDLSTVIRQQVVPYTVKLLTDEQIVVRKVGHSSLKVLLENNILDNSQLNEWICPLIAELVTFGSSEELRSEDVSGMCKMIPFIGKEITEKFFLSPFISLCCDSSFTIRKVCAVNFGSICKVVETETMETTMLPAFLNLCNDEIWGIRKECADVFVDVAITVTDKTRREILPHIFISLLNDESRYVKLAAYQSLGGFIATFADPSKTGWKYVNGTFIKIPIVEPAVCHQEIQCLPDESKKASEGQELKDLNLHQSKQSNLNLFKSIFQKKSTKQTDLYLEQNNSTNLSLKASDGNFSATPNNEFLYSQDDNCTKQKTFHMYQNSDDNINSKMNDVESSHNSQTNLIDCSQISDNGHLLNIDVDNKNNFNNFQFWRTPLPEVELDLEIEPVKCQMKSFFDSFRSATTASETFNTTCTITGRKLRRLACFDTPIEKYEYEKLDEVVDFNLFHLNSIQVKEKDQSQEKSTKLSNVPSRPSKEMTVYDQDIVPPELLTKFLCGVHEEENTTIFAYSFPAVAYTLGQKFWPCIRPVCFLLAGDLKYTVRRTVASFLHELAVFLDHSTIVEDLLPVFLKMSKDIDCVRIKVLEYLSRFLQYLTPNDRRQFLPFIEELLTIESENNWRFRFTIAEQLIPCVALFDLSEVKKFFLPVCVKLVDDKASDVRRSAIQLLAIIIKSFLEDSSSTYKKEVFFLIEHYMRVYKQNTKWLLRQMYVFICQELASQKSLPNELYIEKIIPDLFSLAWDTVPNVRLAVARCLSLTLLPLGYLPGIQKSHYQLLLQVMYSLQSDVDRDVRHFAHLSAGAFNVLPQKKLSPV